MHAKGHVMTVEFESSRAFRLLECVHALYNCEASRKAAALWKLDLHPSVDKDRTQTRNHSLNSLTRPEIRHGSLRRKLKHSFCYYDSATFIQLVEVFNLATCAFPPVDFCCLGIL